MAGDWIKLEHVTPGKPEVFRMAEYLHISENEVLGGLLRVWIWADQQSIDGNDLRVTKALLDRYSSVTNFSDALEEVGWLRVRGDVVSLPNFDRHNGNTAKQRALTMRRVAKHRQDDRHV